MTTVSDTGCSPRPRGAQPAPGQDGYWAVEVHGLTKRFGARAAVNDVDLRIPRGCAFGYLGPNGAGKTTLIRLLLGLTRADSGTMKLLGIPVRAARGRALARVGAIVDEPRFHGHLMGRENLKILAAARGGDAAKQIRRALDRTRLTQRADDKVSAYSLGMRQRLAVAACLLADPQLLIFDEPMNGWSRWSPRPTCWGCRPGGWRSWSARWALTGCLSRRSARWLRTSMSRWRRSGPGRWTRARTHSSPPTRWC